VAAVNVYPYVSEELTRLMRSTQQAGYSDRGGVEGTERRAKRDSRVERQAARPPVDGGVLLFATAG
jgi:hypothetical protein